MNPETTPPKVATIVCPGEHYKPRRRALQARTSGMQHTRFTPAEARGYECVKTLIGKIGLFGQKPVVSNAPHLPPATPLEKAVTDQQPQTAIPPKSPDLICHQSALLQDPTSQTVSPTPTNDVGSTHLQSPTTTSAQSSTPDAAKDGRELWTKHENQIVLDVIKELLATQKISPPANCPWKAKIKKRDWTVIYDACHERGLNRRGKQIYEHFSMSLDPGLDHTPLSKAELKVLDRERNKTPKTSWSKISATYMPTHSSLQLRNTYACVKKYKRKPRPQKKKCSIKKTTVAPIHKAPLVPPTPNKDQHPRQHSPTAATADNGLFQADTIWAELNGYDTELNSFRAPDLSSSSSVDTDLQVDSLVPLLT